VNNPRLVALVRRTDLHPESRHVIGLPRELANRQEGLEVMPWPRVLLIVKRPDGVFLDRYDENGRPAGDTWHMSVQDAQDQAEEEYEGMLTEWREVPPTIDDDALLRFALSSLE
jgi:hypothetical protein